MADRERDRFESTLPVATAMTRGLGRPAGGTVLLVHEPAGGTRLVPLAPGQGVVIGRDLALAVPPLRERLEEVAALAGRFVASANAANGCAVPGIVPRALRQLHRYDWPGNVRELRNVLERAVIIARDRNIELDDLPERVRRMAGVAPREPTPREGAKEASSPSALPVDLREHLRQQEVALILAALEQSAGQRADAAKLLGLPVRTLSHKMSQLGIKRGAYGSGDEAS